MDEPALLRTSWTHNLPLEHELQLERKAVRKLDYTILPMMAMFYFLSALDRVNIGNARVAGLQTDLHLTDKQYQICITILFVTYISVELPSNLLLRKVGARVLMPTVLVIWGMVVIFQGLVTSFAGLATVRACLGLLEGPMYPGIVLYLSGFYTRKELSFRITLLFSIASVALAFSGLLAAAIENMKGIGGRSGWTWIFVLEGLFSVLVGITSSFVVPSNPHGSKFLTEKQKDIIMKRLEKDRPSIQPIDTFSFKELLQTVASPQVIMTSIMCFMNGTIIFGLAYFLPSIVKQMGFSPNKTQLLSVGPFAGGFFASLISAFYSDRYGSRGIPIAFASTFVVAGLALYLSAEETFTSYGALYLMVSGASANAPLLAAWMANNSEPYYRRSTSIALGFIANNCGGILSTWSFPTTEGPKFRKTTTLNLIFSILLVVGSLTNMLYLTRRNRVKKHPLEREKLLKKYGEGEKNGDDGELRDWMELGDRHPDFVYTL